MFIVHEGNIHSYRQIFMDGRKHPAELDPTWFGHSIGWWEKDTLVNDVTIDDPGAYSKPWTAKLPARLSPGDELMENICQENNQFGIAGGHANPFAQP